MYSVNFDSDGVVLQTDGDGGDSAGRTGDYHSLAGIYRILGMDLSQWPKSSFADWNSVRKVLIQPDGTVLRYTKSPYNDPKDVSRDQTMPLAISCVVNDTLDSLEAIWDKVKSNEFRFQNGDLCGPQDVAIFEMGLHSNFLATEEIALGVAQLWGSAFVRCAYARRNFDDVGDDINLTLYLLCAKLCFPCWESDHACSYYAKNRAAWGWPAGTDPKQTAQIVQGNGAQYAWDRYFRPDTFANPFNELARPLISKYFSP